MSKLDEISIKGYKSIKELNLNLNYLNVLIGANGAGKSNFISFFKILNNLVNENLQNAIAKSGGADRLFFFGPSTTEEISFSLKFKKNSYFVTWKLSDDGRMYFYSEKSGFFGQGYLQPLIKELGKGHFETLLLSESKSARNRVVEDYIIENLSEWKVYHFHDTSDTSKLKMNVELENNDFFKEDGSNLASYLYLLKKKYPENYKNILQTVQLVAPFIKDFYLVPSKLNENLIRLRWVSKQDNTQFDVSQLSDGTLRFICIAVLLLQPNLPSTIILDEPELGLHPFAINILSSLFKTTSLKTQIIISTQSLLLMDNFEPKDIIVVDYINNESLFKRLDNSSFEEWLEDYTLGELWEKNLLGGRPRI